MSAIRVLLVDDHTLVRAGIRALLADVRDFKLVAEAEDGESVLELVRTCKPDVVLMDISLPTVNGLQATERLLREFPAVRVIILSIQRSEEYVIHALRAGASGYLLKDTDRNELEIAIRAVALGKHYLAPAVLPPVIDGYLARVAQSRAPTDRLTSRQCEILRLVAVGRSTKEIARELGISVKTVETHRAQIMDRLDIYDIPGLVRFAMRVGLVPRES